MKKTGYRLVSAGGILIAIGALTWGILSFSRMDINFNKVIVSEFKGEATSVPVSGCSIFKITGIWDLTISKGPPSLKIYADAEQVKQLKIEQTGQQLLLSTGSGFKIGQGYRAEISMPNLEGLTLQGGARLTLKDISAKKFSLDIAGASSVNINGVAIEDLSLVCNGASSIEAGNSKINNATVSIAGTSNVILGMNGGTLGGTIDGLGHLVYTGTVSSENVKTNGIAKIEHK